VLKRVLQTIAAGRVSNTAELAAALDTSPAMVEAMVEQLARSGMLERVGECGDACAGCPVEGCGAGVKGSAWMLTAAGRRYAAH
jgi:hypothetical protein